MRKTTMPVKRDEREATMADVDDKTLLEDKEVSRAVKDMSPAKLSVKDVYERLCANRDREIELVWKRAVFLTAFLRAWFTAYGGLLAAYIGSGPNPIAPFAVISVAAIGIGFVGTLLSIIWIQMAKGSKAWYEHYEKVIECFVKNHSSDEDLDAFAFGDYRKLTETDSIEKDAFRRLEIQETDRSLLNVRGGRFSVSKIVILLGQLFACVWAAIIALHGLYLFENIGKLETQIKRFFGGDPSKMQEKYSAVCEKVVLVLAIVFALIFVFFLVTYGMNCRSKSGYLDKIDGVRKKRIGKQSFWSRIGNSLANRCPLRKVCPGPSQPKEEPK